VDNPLSHGFSRNHGMSNSAMTSWLTNDLTTASTTTMRTYVFQPAAAHGSKPAEIRPSTEPLAAIMRERIESPYV
jgi:hypothetical protein